MNDITLQIEGRRAYVIGNTFPHKNALKNAGAHWDADRKAWWIGNREKAQELLERLASSAAAAPADAPAQDGLKDDDRVAGKAKYKGKSYLLVWEGETRKGYGYKLSFSDGTKIFWASEGVEVTKHYNPTEYRGRTEYMTFGRLRRLQENWKRKTDDEKADAKSVSEHGGKCRCSSPLDEGDGECMNCGYFICS